MTAIKERTAAILTLLAEAKGHMLAGELAERLGVSTKTVSRDLPEAEKYLAACGTGIYLEKKKGAGLRLRGSEAALAELFERLGQVKKHSYTPEERLSIIVSRLLPEKEPVKLFYLSSLLGVTDSTISNDLDKLEGWFEGRGLTLVRKPGLGVYVEGEERRIRQAIIAYIYDHVTEEELLHLVQQSLRPESSERAYRASSYLLDLVDKEILHRLDLVIRRAEKDMDRHLSDQAFIGIMVHLALAVQRLRKGERIELKADYLANLREKKEYAAASAIGAEIGREFSLTVPEDEIGYIAMHLLGARSRYREESVTGAVLDNFHLVRLAKSIMRAAEEKSGQPLRGNGDLLAGLVNHLGPAISRLEMKMDIRNPLLSEMQEKFPELMELAGFSVRQAEQDLGVKFPPAELGYIAMHLSAALMGTDFLSKLTARVIVACPTGLGTSRLLSGQLKKYYDDTLTIVDLAATLNISPAYFESHQADFVVSTVPIPNPVLPVVVVGPLLTEEDRRHVDEAIRRSGEAMAARKAMVTEKHVDFVSALRILSLYQKAILTLLDNFFFLDETKAMMVQEVASAVGNLVGSSPEEKRGIAKALLNREDQGSTAVHGSRMILLHARNEAVGGLRLGIVRLGKGFLYPAEPGEKIDTALVMLAHKDCSCYEFETIGHISSILLERWGFMEMLHEGDERQIKAELIRIFREFYELKHQELMES